MAITLRDTAEATLLFYRIGLWTRADRDRWQVLTGTTEATTKNLCEAIRKALEGEK